ncbi:uncharacterized protein DMENIID0001_125280 [Sergentomyia squamirostris]
MTNDNGQRLADFAAARGLIVSSTHFPHKDIHKGTWKSPDGLTLNQIDHVLVSGRHASSVLDVKVRRGANIESDHFMVQMKFRGRLSARSQNRNDTITKWNLDALKNENVCNDFQKIMREGFEVAGYEGGEVEEKWMNLKCVKPLYIGQ